MSVLLFVRAEYDIVVVLKLCWTEGGGGGEEKKKRKRNEFAGLQIVLVTGSFPSLSRESSDLT